VHWEHKFSDQRDKATRNQLEGGGLRQEHEEQTRRQWRFGQANGGIGCGTKYHSKLDKKFYKLDSRNTKKGDGKQKVCCSKVELRTWKMDSFVY